MIDLSGTRVGVLGGGSIGVAFAVQFASRRGSVRVWDPVAEARSTVRARAESIARMLADAELVAEDPQVLVDRIEVVDELATACRGTEIIQECAPERLPLKQDLLRQVAGCTDDDQVLASSTSAFRPTDLGEGNQAAHRILVAHPGNPPYLLPVIELVRGEETSDAAVSLAGKFFEAAGMHVVELGAETEGFVFNRLQGAVLREAYCLLRDGVATVEQIDALVRYGPGRRWAFMGPFETADLNTRGGLEAHAERMGPAYARMGAERGQDDPWTPELVATAVAQRRALLPLEQWEDRVRWRDEQLIRLRVLDES